MSHLVCFAQYELQVEVTRCVEVPGDLSTWDSDWDYHGYRELEFEVVSGIAYDEADENPQDLGATGCAAVAEQCAEIIEEKLWAELDDEKDDTP